MPHLEHEIIINAKAKTFEKNNVKICKGDANAKHVLLVNC